MGNPWPQIVPRHHLAIGLRHRDHRLQFLERLATRRTLRQMRVAGGALDRRELAVQIFRQPLSPVRVHVTSPQVQSSRFKVDDSRFLARTLNFALVTLNSSSACVTSYARDGAAISMSQSRRLTALQSLRAGSPRCRAARTRRVRPEAAA